jgi:hypothetical protein
LFAVAVIPTDTPYMNAPPQYSESVQAGHLKVTEGPLPPRYSDIINPPVTGDNSCVTSLTTDSSASSSARPPDSLRLQTARLDVSETADTAATQQHEERATAEQHEDTDRKDEAETPTHDRAGLVENEIMD